MSYYLSQTFIFFYFPSERIYGRKLIGKHNDLVFSTNIKSLLYLDVFVYNVVISAS